MARTCFPSGGQEHGVFSWEPQHSPLQGLRVLSGKSWNVGVVVEPSAS